MIQLFDDFRDLLVELHKAGARFVVLEIDGCAIPVIGRGALIKNERAAGRPQDIANVNALDSE